MDMIAKPGHVTPEAVRRRSYPPPVRRDEKSQLQLRMAMEQPGQVLKCPLVEITARFIRALRSSWKDIVDGHDDRGRFARTIPGNRTQLGRVQYECATQRLRRSELPIFHARIPDR